MADIEIPRTFVVYKVTNLVNGKLYIGVTSGTRGVEAALRKRWNEHQRLARGSRFTGYLQMSIRKHGAESFKIEPVYEAVDERELWAVERGLIAQHGTMDRAVGYNASSGGENISGVARAASTKEKLSEINAAAWTDPKFRERMIAAFETRVFPESHFEHLRRQAALMKGKKRKPESVAKGSASLMGHAVSEETRKKIGDAIRGRKAKPEHIEKQRLAQTGKKHSEEWKQAIGAAHRALWSDPEKRAARAAKIAASHARNGTKSGPKRKAVPIQDLFDFTQSKIADSTSKEGEKD